MQSQDPDQQKNLLLAVILSMAVLLGWQLFYAGPKIAREKAQQEQSQTVKPGQPGTSTATDSGIKAPVATPEGAVPGTAPANAAAQTREDAIKATPRLAVETPSLKGSINLQGGRVDDLVLVKYRETVDPTSPYVTLFSPTNSPQPYFAEYGWVAAGGGSDLKVPDRNTVWRIEGGATALTPEKPVTLSWDNGAGLIFHRAISVDTDYMFKIADSVENRGSASVTLVPYARVYRYGTPKVQGYWILHEGLIGVADQNVSWCGSVLPSILCQLKYKDALKDGERAFNSTGGWLGFTDKYWAATLIPDQAAPFHAEFKGEEKPNETAWYQTDYRLDPLVIAAGATGGIKSQLFAGAKEVKLLQAYESNDNIKQFDLLIDWGWFFFITKPMFYLMEIINSVVHNFGVTILVLTVFVRLAFFPLANKQYSSMAKMKKLQPQMEQLRERYKDDKARQQQELMELYKREKVNPVAGCLPVLLQLPVFFALYKVLFVTIEMRHAPFFGWIKDLSAPDPTSLFNLFGLLPFDPPPFLHVGVWPLIMGITMWLQMQLNPKQPDPVQQQIFSFMPLMFTFLLASFPAGLVIYWAWSNTLSLAQQYFIMKRQGAEIHLMGNLSNAFKSVTRVTDKAIGVVKPQAVRKGSEDDDDAKGSGRGGSKGKRR